MSAEKRITLSSGWTAAAKTPEDYRVVKVANSVAYKPDDRLNKAEVSGLCDNAAWDVTIIKGPAQCP